MDKKQDSDLVSVKSVKVGEDLNGRQRLELTMGEDKRGIDGLQELINALLKYQETGNPVKLDIRVGEQQSRRGTTFPTAFILVKEVKPLADDAGPKTFVKKESASDRIKSNAKRFEKALD